MKLIILLALAAVSSGAKLDRTYLPPSHAQTSGGNGHFLEAPMSGFINDFQNNDFTIATSNRFAQRNGQKTDYFSKNNEYSQFVNDYAQDNGNNYQDDGSFEQNDNSFIVNSDSGLSAFNTLEQRPERQQAAVERTAEILRQDNKNDGETYAYAYETSNGIVAEENGVATDGVRAQGGYSYTGDDGQVYSVSYTADENGFVAQGDHLPTPPPIPEDILKALNKNAQDEANGIFDDGSYTEGKYSNGQDGQHNDESGYNYNNNGPNFNAAGGGNIESFINDEDSIVTNNALLRSDDSVQSGFGKSGQNNFGNNGVEKAYLPPIQQNAQRGQSSANGRYSPVQNAGFRNQINMASLNSGSGIDANEVERTYLPPSAFGQRKQQPSIRNSGQNGVQRAYLPPQQFRQNNQQGNNINQNGVQRAYLPPRQFGQRNQQVSRNSNGQNGVERAYLPPSQFGQRNQNGSPRGRFALQGNAARKQIPNAVERSYLPPSAEQDQNQSFGNQEPRTKSFASNGVNREYLPPTNQYQRRNSFVSRTFSGNELF